MLFNRVDVWHRALSTILVRHGLERERPQRVAHGTHIVFLVGAHYVLKLFCPVFPDDFMAELAVSHAVSGRLQLETPEVVVSGELEGWPYLVMTRLQGVPIGAIWADVDDKGRDTLVAGVGRLISSVRDLGLRTLAGVPCDWAGFVSRQVATCVDRIRDRGLSEWIVEQAPGLISQFLATDHQKTLSLVLSDITAEHVYVVRESDAWRVSGYLDFGDSQIADPDYELLSPGLDIAGSDPKLLALLLREAGYSPNEANEALQQRLLMYTLLHPYFNLKDVLDRVPDCQAARDLGQLARVLWPIC